MVTKVMVPLTVLPSPRGGGGGCNMGAALVYSWTWNNIAVLEVVAPRWRELYFYGLAILFTMSL